MRLVICDFDGVFTDNTVSTPQDGQEPVRCWRSDEPCLSRLRSVGVETLILSAEVNPVISVRVNKLKISCKQALEEKAYAVIASL